LFLGFHILAIFSHNDSVVAFGDSESQLIIEPQILINLKSVIGAYSYSIGFGDLIAHHAISFGVHVATLIFIRS